MVFVQAVRNFFLHGAGGPGFVSFAGAAPGAGAAVVLAAAAALVAAAFSASLCPTPSFSSSSLPG